MKKFKPIPGFPGYQIGRDGSVWSRHTKLHLGWKKGTKTILGDKWKKVKQYKESRTGYLGVFLCRPGIGKSIHLRVHKLVLETFVGPKPPRHVCRHLDGNPTNNNLTNLEWGTQQDNIRDTAKHGRIPKGVNHHWSKLTEQSVKIIKSRLASGKETQNQIAADFQISRVTISHIKTGKSWKHVVWCER